MVYWYIWANKDGNTFRIQTIIHNDRLGFIVWQTKLLYFKSYQWPLTEKEQKATLEKWLFSEGEPPTDWEDYLREEANLSYRKPLSDWKDFVLKGQWELIVSFLKTH